MSFKIDINHLEKGFSFFEFVKKYCLDESQGYTVNRAFHRLCSLMRKMNAKTVVIEELEPSREEIRDECSALYTYYKQKIKIYSYRFTFITENIDTTDDILKLDNDNFLSSVILINYCEPKVKNWKSYIYSAVITLPKKRNYKNIKNLPLLNNYLHIYRKFPCKIAISKDKEYNFNIIGTFFCQQNSVTSVCAHASLCMTINNMDLSKIKMIIPEDINKILNIDHKKIKFKKNKIGLSKEEIQKVLKEYGLSITWKDFFEDPNDEYNDYIYKYIESRCPVLLVFTTNAINEAHVVPVIGHTLNSDMWSPEARPAYTKDYRLNYKPASAWTDHFIIHDDNFGMYLCLPVSSLKRITLPKNDPQFRANYAVAVIPHGVTTPAWEAEWTSVIVVKHISEALRRGTNITNLDEILDDWSYRVLQSDYLNPPRPIVVRTFLVKKDDYKKSLYYEDFEGNSLSEKEIHEIIGNLPNRFWLSEITLPDLYTANKTKIIDFFYPSDLPNLHDIKDIYKRWIQIRFPGVLLRYDPSQLSYYPLSVKSHYPLFRFDNEHEIIDW